ncbi:NB-ARC domain-containing protein [Hamadaea tsunoensis]|uniref:NB-ARC domain-containing protein n=1 Tax=Hamadaea tsunoensis TaxID=53368 RepID=UPI00041180CD|nr:NB-ARC domain-containing protein [Hamadaea tsunoensis]
MTEENTDAGTLPRWRKQLRTVRRRLRSLRLPLAALAGVVTTVLSTIYEDLPPGLRYAALGVVGVLSGVALLLTEFGSTKPADYTRDVSGDWPTSVRVSTPRVGRRQRPSIKPPGTELFAGREAELGALLASHRNQRADRDARPSALDDLAEDGGFDPPAIGCVTLYLHGQPGVGKSAIAWELAARLAPQYDHVISVDLGTAGTARPPGDVLKDLLLQLGWSEHEMPEERHGRAVAFRTITAGHNLLFIFDAARTADQVKMILPTDPQNAVIVTSRRDLTSDPEMQATPSMLIQEPSAAEALEIFRLMSLTNPLDRPECAAEIVELCGRLPVAIRSAAERIAVEGTNICAVATYLSEDSTRLSRLEQPGRPVRTILQTEFDRLLQQEQKALVYLSLLPSRSFSPWILIPLLGVHPGEAEALADRLVAAQMLEVAAPAAHSGISRYTMHALTWLFARQHADDLPEEERTEALDQVDQAYQALIATVLNVHTPDKPIEVPAAGIAQTPQIARRIAEDLTGWVVAEHANLLHEIEVAFAAGRYGLCWRLAVLLDGTTPLSLDFDATDKAYRKALEAARLDSDDKAVAKVQIAVGRFYAAVGRYEDAESGLAGAYPHGGSAPARRPTAAEVRSQLALAETLLQAGSHDLASEKLQRCLRQAKLANDSTLVHTAEIMIAYNHHVECPYWVQDRLLDDTLDTAGRFYAQLAFADSACRGREWRTAFEHLDAAERMAASDLSRGAYVALRASEASLRHAWHLSRAQTAGRARDIAIGRTIEWACIAMRRYRGMRYPGGEYRAKCQLARAFGAAELLGVAEQLADRLYNDVRDLQRDWDRIHQDLLARVHQVRGELLFRFGDRAAARAELIRAAGIFSLLGDPMSEGDVRDTIQTPPAMRRPR